MCPGNRIRSTALVVFCTPPEATNTGPGFNRGSEGGARGCDFEEEQVGHVRIQKGAFPLAAAVCPGKNKPP